jgi:hypothetical protein
VALFGILNIGPGAAAARRGFDVRFDVDADWLRAEHPAPTLAESLERSGHLGTVIRSLRQGGWTWAEDDDEHALPRLEAPLDRSPRGEALLDAVSREARPHVNYALDRGFTLVRAETWMTPHGVSGDSFLLGAPDGLTLLVDGRGSGRLGPTASTAPSYQQWLRLLEPEQAMGLFATRDTVAIIDALLTHRAELLDPSIAGGLLRR